jgi:hypothetical protein
MGNMCDLLVFQLGGQLVLTEQQREEKKAAEAELAFSKSELEKEVDPVKSKFLREEVIAMEKRLDELLLSFEVHPIAEISMLVFLTKFEA